MQAAFVDIGLDKAAFYMPPISCRTPNVWQAKSKSNLPCATSLSLVRQGRGSDGTGGKDPLGTKGARLTTDITLPSRYLVFMPGASHVGVSQRIESESERERLKSGQRLLR